VPEAGDTEVIVGVGGTAGTVTELFAVELAIDAVTVAVPAATPVAYG
jgi:hypothetical protein